MQDPVCHMEIDAAAAEFHYDFEGTTYYFCWEGCLNKFKANPRFFLDPQYDPAKVDFDAMGDTKFTCPMDPEVISDAPGPCPICGMALEPMTPTLELLSDNSELHSMSKRFALAALLTVPTVVLAMGPMAGIVLPVTVDAGRWIQLGLCTPVLWWCGFPILDRALASVRNRSLNMFTLIGAGSAISYIFSLYATIFPKTLPSMAQTHGETPIYFETTAVIVTLVLLGQVLELKARHQAAGAIRELLELTPKQARKVGENNEEFDIPIAAVVTGDRLRVRDGEGVPVDGTIISGAGSLDEAMLSGEPYPVAKSEGDTVTGGTINTQGSFVMQAERVGDQTLLSQIIKTVAEAQRSQAPVQRLADKVASYFVPAVIGLAGLTFAVWLVLGPKPTLVYALINAIAVLIIACPCALGLATPMSIIVAAGRGAKAGILVRNAAVLETAERVNVVAFDKTGTLTAGKPKVQAVITTADITEEDVLRTACALELHSTHPFALAILTHAQTQGITPAAAEDIQTMTGKGIRGRLDEHIITIGNERFMDENGIEVGTIIDTNCQPDEASATKVFVARGHNLLGIVSISDPVKPATADALDQLRRLGIETVMITGDNAFTATALGGKLGFGAKEVYAEVLPDEKGNIIEAIRSAGKVVAMAGDGVNDAIALAKADVGIAMGNGSDVAMNTADITLLKGELPGVVRALKLSRLTMQNIRQNLFFAFIYNAIGLIIATGLFYPWFGLLLNPMIAAAAMSLSSVCVISNALRLGSARI